MLFQRSIAIPFRLRVVLGHGVLLSTVFAPTASAQSIEGRTIDATSGDPINLVEIELVDSAGRRLNATSSDWDGRFRFGPLAAARYTLRATRIGYDDATVENVRVMLDSVTRIDVELTTDVVQIEGVDVNVRRGPDVQHLATYEGLYTRRGEKRWANVVGTNRVWVHSDFAHVSTMSARQYILQNAPPSLGRGGVLSGDYTPRRGPRKMMCSPMFSLRGGLPMPAFVAEAYLSQPVDDFEGIEIFGHTWEAPVAMRPDGHSSCGMIVLWPRRKPGER